MKYEMIERVARALCKAAEYDPDMLVGNDEPCWISYFEAAKAAIEAMREPTDAMADAGWTANRVQPSAP